MRIKFKSYEKTEEERIAAGAGHNAWYLCISAKSMMCFANTVYNVIDPDAKFLDTRCYKIERPSWGVGSYYIAKWLVEEIEED